MDEHIADRFVATNDINIRPGSPLSDSRISTREMAFENAVCKRPESAPETENLEWIAAHPAMTLMARSTRKTKTIYITPEDILYAPHGPAPSMKAARDLQHWSNTAAKFRSDYSRLRKDALAMEKQELDIRTATRKELEAQKAAAKSSTKEEKLRPEYMADLSEIREMIKYAGKEALVMEDGE